MQFLTSASSEDLRRLRDADEFFWLDLTAPTLADCQTLVDTAGFDSEAAERAVDFNRVPQLRRYRDHVGLVFYGAQADGLIEVHAYVSGDWVVTLHADPCQVLDGLRDELAQGPPQAEESVVGSVLDALADSFDDFVDPIDERIERTEHEAVRVEEGQASAVDVRREILDRRGRLLRSLRIVRRQRDYIDRAVDDLADLPGLQPSQHHELRDVATQMIRVTDTVDNALDRLAAALDLLNASVSNRMNAIMERLTVVATIFLPLTAATGFFGMNFAWLVRHIDSFASFLAFGVVFLVASGIGTWAWVRNRLEGPAQSPSS